MIVQRGGWFDLGQCRYVAQPLCDTEARERRDC